ncbi:hypothetical protein BMA0112 [Burkholderia mallei ATCC 23344]|uniref:Uncharacterized protein n=1 Tax=Burkholderia mallei (strain ATCC 23344) TaxID=243160 RepID=A0A0H2WGP9_BURMA|nr:hypothetical protein BMA0112 [Burkholderia mallei ATCC 23344]
MRARRRAELPPPATASRGRKRKTARRAPGRSIPPWPGLPWARARFSRRAPALLLDEARVGPEALLIAVLGAHELHVALVDADVTCPLQTGPAGV